MKDMLLLQKSFILISILIVRRNLHVISVFWEPFFIV